jgi:hypothetical protein
VAGRAGAEVPGDHVVHVDAQQLVERRAGLIVQRGERIGGRGGLVRGGRGGLGHAGEKGQRPRGRGHGGTHHAADVRHAPGHTRHAKDKNRMHDNVLSGCAAVTHHPGQAPPPRECTHATRQGMQAPLAQDADSGQNEVTGLI